jgi:hypothetical protein
VNDHRPGSEPHLSPCECRHVNPRPKGHSAKLPPTGHRTQFKDEKREDIFPGALGYFYQKIAECLDGGIPGTIGTMHLDYITEMIKKFQQALDRRGLLQAHNMDDLDIIAYPIAELRKYFETPTESQLNAKDANIFLAFIRSQTDSLITFAREIDEDSAEGV